MIPKRELFLFQLKEKEIYDALCIDIISRNEAILNIQGNDIRVKNKTEIKTGDTVKVRVKSIQPNLIFEVIPSSKSKKRSSFDHTSTISIKG